MINGTLDRVVNNLDESTRFFSDLFGTTFDNPPQSGVVRSKKLTEFADQEIDGGPRAKAAFSQVGLELVETIPPPETEGVSDIQFKVPNLDEAKVEMEARGIKLLVEIQVGGFREAVYSPEFLHGTRMALVEYRASTPVEAMNQA